MDPITPVAFLAGLVVGACFGVALGFGIVIIWWEVSGILARRRARKE